MKQSKQITEGAMLLAVFVILLLFTMFVPVISFLGFFLIPVPFILYASRYSWQPSLVMLGAALLLSLLFVPVVTLPLSVFAGLGGIMIGVAIHDKLTPHETWARGTLGYVFGLLFVFLFTQYFLNINYSHEFQVVIDESLETTMGLLQSVGLENQQLDEIQQLMEDNFSNVLKLIPVMLVVIAMVIGFVSQWMSYKVMNRTTGNVHQFPPFRSFKLPKSIIWLYVIALLIVWFDTDSESAIAMGANNVYALIGLLMVLQGFSFMFFFAHLKKKSKALPITAIILTVLFPMVLFYLVLIIGIIDLGFDLRKYLSEKEK